MNNIRVLESPFEPWVAADCRILILGSFPSVKAIEQGYYYGNPQNRFYALMSALLNEDLVCPSGVSKKDILLKHHIAICDVVASCRIKGSSDASIQTVKFINLKAILEGTHIRHIFLNGGTATNLFDKAFPEMIDWRTKLPSTSPANARMRLANLVDAWSPIYQYLRPNNM